MFYKKIAGAGGLLLGVGTVLYMYQRPKTHSMPEIQSPTIKFSSVIKSSESPRLLPFFRPNDGVHVHYAVQAYKDNGGEVLNEQGWELLGSHKQEKNGYFGVAYRHIEKQHIIIAHRGTEGLDRKDWKTNFDFIVRGLSSGQETSAWEEFAKKIIEQYGESYSYSFTGHSLGGWLAQASLWQYQDEFVRNKAYKDGFAVTLDEPGAKELFKALKPQVATAYGLEVDNLDITTYLSVPNLVNAAGWHVGSVYALFPDTKNFSFVEQHITYTKKVHDCKTLLKEFTKEGLPKQCARVLSWPKIESGEYLRFFNYKVNKLDEVSKLPTTEQFDLKYGNHYNIKDFDEQVVPLRNMPSSMRRFLEELNGHPDRLKVISQLISSQVSLPLDAYFINDYQEIVLDKTKTTLSPRVFQNELLEFLNRHPQLHQINLSILRDQYFERRLQAGTLAGLLEDLQEQHQYTETLLSRLSFQQGTARLYKFIKPSFDEIKRLEYEARAFDSQLNNVKSLKLKLESLKADQGVSQSIAVQLEQRKKQLTLSQQMIETLWLYMQGSSEAKKGVDKLISLVASEGSAIQRFTLLNRAYNLKAKIEARDSNNTQAIESYKQAVGLLPEDALTLSNYGGLLTDIGYDQDNPDQYLEAYNCFQQVNLERIPFQQMPIAASGMAYGLLLLAQSIEQGQLHPTGIPNIIELRRQAQDLLEQSIKINPNYLNARLFSAILRYDQKDYPVALEEVNNALTLQPSHPRALMRKGFILQELGRSEDALEFLEQAKRRLGTKPIQNARRLKETDEHINNILAQKQQKKVSKKSFN